MFFFYYYLKFNFLSASHWKNKESIINKTFFFRTFSIINNKTKTKQEEIREREKERQKVNQKT